MGFDVVIKLIIPSIHQLDPFTSHTKFISCHFPYFMLSRIILLDAKDIEELIDRQIRLNPMCHVVYV